MALTFTRATSTGANIAGGVETVTFGCEFSNITNESINGKKYVTDFGNSFWQFEVTSPPLTRTQLHQVMDVYNQQDETLAIRWEDTVIYPDVIEGLSLLGGSASRIGGGIIGTRGDNFLTFRDPNGSNTGVTTQLKRGQFFKIEFAGATVSGLGLTGNTGSADNKVYMIREDITINTDQSTQFLIPIFPRLLQSYVDVPADPDYYYRLVEPDFMKVIAINDPFVFDSDVSGYFQYKRTFREVF